MNPISGRAAGLDPLIAADYLGIPDYYYRRWTFLPQKLGARHGLAASTREDVEPVFSAVVA
jgi:hypothetical protein